MTKLHLQDVVEALVETIITKARTKDGKKINQSDELDVFTNQMIDKITKNLENFHYNVIIANLHEIYNYLSKNINFERSFSIIDNKNYLDLYDAAKVILEGLQIKLISGGDRCTFLESNEFFSYRRDGINSGRMAHLIWMT